MKIKSKFKSPITKEKQEITKRTNIQTAIQHKPLSIIINIILKQIANKIIKKITKFQIFISILINDYSKLKYLFAFSNHSGGNL